MFNTANSYDLIFSMRSCLIDDRYRLWLTDTYFLHSFSRNILCIHLSIINVIETFDIISVIEENNIIC